MAALPVEATAAAIAAPMSNLTLDDNTTVSHKDSEDNDHDDANSHDTNEGDDDNHDDETDADSYIYEDSDNEVDYTSAAIEDDNCLRNAAAATEFKPMADSPFADSNQLAASIKSLHETLQRDAANVNPELDIRPLRSIDIIVLAHQMIELRQQFESVGINGTIDIGYYQPQAHYVAYTQTDGLLRKNGLHGDGIYTCDSTFKNTASFADVGVMVARLKGNCGKSKIIKHKLRLQNMNIYGGNDDVGVHTVVAGSI